MSYQKATRAFISLVVLASIALAAAWAVRYPAEISPTWPLWFVFIFLIALSLHHPLDHLPADTIPIFAALLLFPPPEFIAVIALGVLAGGKKPGTTTLEFLFHLGRNLLSAAVCAWIFFQFTGGTWSQPNLIVLGGAVAAGASLILINSLLTSGETSIDLHRPFLLQWRRGVETSLGSEALMLSLGLLAAVVVKASPWSVLIIAVSGAAVYRAFQRQAAVGNEQRALVETSARTASNLRAERDRLKESCAELESVAAVIHSLRSAHNRDEIVPMIMDHVCARMQVASGMICLVDPENRKSSVAAARGKWERMTGLRLPPGEGISSKVLAGGMTYVHPDIRIDPDFRTPSRFDGDYSVVGVPMTCQDGSIGVLWAGKETGFGPREIHLLETLADIAASALHRAGLIDHLQRETRSLAAKADALTAAFDATLEGWSRALELRDSSAEGHTQRVSEMSQRLGRAAGMSLTELEHLRRGSLLHDIGKTSVSDAILKRPGPLNAEEWAAIRRHPQLAHDLLAPVPLLNSALAVPTGHHERWDGSGYPRGLVGEQIPLAARVFALADVWDALTHGRPYRRAWSPEKALEYIRGESGRHFDPRLVEMFLMLVEEGAGEPEALDLSVTA